MRPEPFLALAWNGPERQGTVTRTPSGYVVYEFDVLPGNCLARRRRRYVRGREQALRIGLDWAAAS